MTDPDRLPALYEQYLDELEADAEKPWNDASRTCEMDGYEPCADGDEQYWHCDRPATFRATRYAGTDLDYHPPVVMLVCAPHAEQFESVTPLEERRH